jgi:hypothetical protein
MSSVLSSWFYILTLGIGFLLLVALVFIFFKPSLFLELTSVSGQVIDLTGVNDFTETNPATIAGTASAAVIKIGANSYSIANNTVATLPNAFVAPLPSTGKTAADDVAGAKVTGTFFFWLLMLGIGFLTLLLAFIAVKYPEKLFGPQVSALVGCLPKTKSPCSSSSSGCSTRTSSFGGLSSLLGGSSGSSGGTNPVQPVVVPTTPPPVVVAAPPPPPAPKPPETTTAAPTSPGFTPAQLAVLQQIMAAMAVSKPSTPTS